MFGLCGLCTRATPATQAETRMEPTQVVHIVKTPAATATAKPSPTAQPIQAPAPVTPTPKPSPTPASVTPTPTPVHPTATPTPQPAVNGNPWGYNFIRGDKIYNPPDAFCDYFNCINSFWNGQGYVVQCQDGMYSQTGGNWNSCQWHGGNRRPLYSH